MIRVCVRCGHDGADADLFCSRCGAPLIEPDLSRDSGTADTLHGSHGIPAVGSAGAGLAHGAAMLVVHRGPGEGSEFLLSGDSVVAGRSRESDLFLDDVTVSRSHAIFERNPDGWFVRDCDSLNGTYVNRHRVDTHQLRQGDEVQIGKYRFIFVVGEGGASA